MRRLHRATPLVLAVASGLATSALLYVYLAAQASVPHVATLTTVPMVVAARPIEANKPVDVRNLSIVQVTERPADSFRSVDEVKSRMPLVTIPAGEPVLLSHLAAKGAAPGLWNRIPPGKRAVTVPIDEVSGVGGFLKPGLNVDVIGVAHGEKAWESRTVAQDLPVLAIAQKDQADRRATDATLVSSATLLVSPQQAVAIALAEERGKVQLMLRTPSDHQVVPQPHVAAPPPSVIVVRERSERPAAPPPPAPPRGIEVINGDQTEVVHP